MRRAAGWELDWWIGAEDRWHVPGREAAVRQHRIDDMPVVQTAMRVPGGDAVQSVFAAPAGDVGEVAVVEIANESPAPFVVALVVRGASAVELGGSTAFVDGRSALRTTRPPSRWAMAADGTTEELVTSGQASDAPFAARRDRGARLVAAFLYPVAHRTSLRAVVALGTRGIGAVEPPGLPDAAAVARGWTAQLDRGMQVELPDDSLARSIRTARAATVLAGQAWKVAPAVVAVLEDWGLDPEAASAWGRLTGRERRKVGRRTAATDGSWAEVRARASRAPMPRSSGRCAPSWCATRTTRPQCSPTGRPSGTASRSTYATRRPDAVPCRIRSAGTASDRLCSGRPPRGRACTVPGLDPTWSTTDARGEALLAAPTPRR